MLLFFVAIVFYLLKVHLDSERFLGKLQTAGVAVPKHYPLVGTVPMSVAVNALDGGMMYLKQTAKRFRNRPYAAPLLGRDCMVIFTNPRHCLDINRRSEDFVRGWGFQHDAPVLGATKELLFSNEGPAWKQQRSTANPHFKPSVLRDQFPSVIDSCKLVETRMDQYVKSGEVVDFKTLCAEVTLRVILRHAFGKVDEPLVKELSEFFAVHLSPEFTLRCMGAKYVPLPNRIPYFKSRGRMLEQVKKSIKDAVPGSYLAMQEGDDDMEGKVADALGIVFAGHDTTSNSLAWAIYFLSQSEKANQRLQAELREIMGDRSIDEMTLEDVKNAPFLQACVNETLRLRSPAPGHVGDVVSPEGAEVDGILLPQGSVCFSFFSAYYLDEDYFDNAESFDPDRWLDGRVKAKAESIGMSVSEFFNPFLPGKHTCIGRVLAELEARVVLARWALKYQIEHKGKEEPKLILSVAMSIDKLPVIIKQ